VTEPAEGVLESADVSTDQDATAVPATNSPMITSCCAAVPASARADATTLTAANGPEEQ
jgi:hypothetical protein